MYDAETKNRKIHKLNKTSKLNRDASVYITVGIIQFVQIGIALFVAHTGGASAAETNGLVAAIMVGSAIGFFLFGCGAVLVNWFIQKYGD